MDKEKTNGLEDQIVSVLERAFYSGERISLKRGDMVVGVVPPEDLALLQDLEKPSPALEVL